MLSHFIVKENLPWKDLEEKYAEPYRTDPAIHIVPASAEAMQYIEKMMYYVDNNWKSCPVFVCQRRGYFQRQDVVVGPAMR